MERLRHIIAIHNATMLSSYQAVVTPYLRLPNAVIPYGILDSDAGGSRVREQDRLRKILTGSAPRITVFMSGEPEELQTLRIASECNARYGVVVRSDDLQLWDTLASPLFDLSFVLKVGRPLCDRAKRFPHLAIASEICDIDRMGPEVARFVEDAFEAPREELPPLPRPYQVDA